MRIGAVHEPEPSAHRSIEPIGSAHSDSRSERSRSLVPVAATACEVRSGAIARPSAAFLAHLIAARDAAPQTRPRRRKGAEEGAAHYADCAEPRPAAGRLVRRTT